MIPSSQYPKKHLPAPFQRPSISIGETKRRQWGWVLPESIKKGDVVPDFGVVESDAFIAWATSTYVRIHCRGKTGDFDPQVKIWAFTHM